MNTTASLIIDGKSVPINAERNLLEVIRHANIDLPTFCYHSDLSIYGACRMCFVQVEGRGIMAACSTKPEAGMQIRTTTEEIREIRKMAVELLLASHDNACPTCSKSSSCKLQSLAQRMGVTKIRFKASPKHAALDTSSPSLVRDPNKCILCGDCVRMCGEVQGIGAIDFAGRGPNATVAPAFGKDLAGVECVNCGQCAAVCPTGALVVKSEVEGVWKALDHPKKKVVVQIAPAVRVALGEQFGMKPGELSTGLIVAALKTLGFDKIFDTAFAADLTVIEEATEFLTRVEKGERLPQFTSCCPAWVKYAEQHHPEILSHLSTCRSPQQMFGSIAREVLPAQMKVENQDLVIVAIMPCTAKKFEARRPEFAHEKIQDVDFVLTTQELARMIEEAGIRFSALSPESLDMPLGFKTGAGVIFGTTGGVTEAVLRYAAEKIGGIKLESCDFHQVRGTAGLREVTLQVGKKTLKLAIVHSLKNAQEIAERVKAGTCDYDLIEVMACPGGCIGGAGQPVTHDDQVRLHRSRGLYEADKSLQLHKAQENPAIRELYDKTLGEAGGQKAHHLLHTGYASRRRISREGMELLTGTDADKVEINVCVGTNCHIKGSQDLLKKMVEHVEETGLVNCVDVKASFCFEKCDRGPTVRIGNHIIEKCTLAKAIKTLEEELARNGTRETKATSPSSGHS